MATPRMNHCAACQQHYYLFEHACPHCGVAAAGGPISRFVRQARMGGLMLFTALTTTACYGSPPMISDRPSNSKTGIEQPLQKLPTKVGTAHMFVTPKGQAKKGTTLKLGTASLEGAKLSLASAEGELNMVVEATEAAAFTPPGPNEPFQSLPVEKMKRLLLEATYTNANFQKATLTVELPGATAAKGQLQLSRLEDKVIGGVLTVDYADTLVEIYFLAAR